MTQVARGTSYTWTGIFRNAADTLVDCADVTLTIADPDGDVLTGFPVALPPVVRVSLGTYTYAWSVPAGTDLGRYDADWAATGDVDGLAYGGSDSVEVVEEGSVTPHVTPVDDVRALVSTTLTDEQLGDIIGREEAWLARRIGQLIGERTETFPLAGYRRVQYEVRLRRPTDVVEVTDNDAAITDVILTHDGWRVAKNLGAGSFIGPVTVTYTPTDDAEVRSVLIDLIRLTIAAGGVTPGFKSESIGDYSYDLGDGAASAYSSRRALVRSLREPPTAGSIPVRVPSSSRAGAVVEAVW